MGIDVDYIARKQPLEELKKLFPNKVLTNEEAEWVRRYYNFFGFEPIETEMVVDEVTFIAMVKKNVIWLEDFVNDGINSIEKNARELPYYNKVVYSNAK